MSEWLAGWLVSSWRGGATSGWSLCQIAYYGLRHCPAYVLWPSAWITTVNSLLVSLLPLLSSATSSSLTELLGHQTYLTF